jgi:hypothetical protein
MRLVEDPVHYVPLLSLLLTQRVFGVKTINTCVLVSTHTGRSQTSESRVLLFHLTALHVVFVVNKSGKVFFLASVTFICCFMFTSSLFTR